MSDIADKIYAATGLTLNAEAAAKIGQMIQQAKRDALGEAAQLAKQTAAVLSNPSARDALNYVAATILELGEE